MEASKNLAAEKAKSSKDEKDRCRNIQANKYLYCKSEHRKGLTDLPEPEASVELSNRWNTCRKEPGSGGKNRLSFFKNMEEETELFTVASCYGEQPLTSSINLSFPWNISHRFQKELDRQNLNRFVEERQKVCHIVFYWQIKTAPFLPQCVRTPLTDAIMLPHSVVPPRISSAVFMSVRLSFCLSVRQLLERQEEELEEHRARHINEKKEIETEFRKVSLEVR